MPDEFITKLLTYLSTKAVTFSKIHLYLVFRNKYNMIKVIKILVLLILFSTTNGFSQQLSHQVLVPAAGLATSSNLNYSQTIGETAVEIMSTGFILTQGFQQPGMLNISNTQPPGTGVEVYPNPATDNITIKLFGEIARNFRIEVINMTGTIIRSMTLEFITQYNIEQNIDISTLSLGIYLVRVTSSDSKISRTFKIEKM